MPHKTKKILLAAGGTGGHFFPAIATGQELTRLGYDVFMVTDKRCEKYTQDLDFISFKIIDLYIRLSNIVGLLKAPWQVMMACFRALIHLIKLRPSLVIGFGGYPSFPTLFATKILGIPIIVHEQNSFLGRSNRFFASSARLIALSYPGDNRLNSKQSSKALYVGDIVRQEFRDSKISNDFKSNILRIFIFGGSQSAKIFSEAIPDAIKLAKEMDPNFICSIVQQAKTSEHAAISEIYKDLNIECELAEFYHNMTKIYQNTDLVIARSGASTIGELSAIGLPAIFIPFPYAAEDHQLHNAKAIEEIGGGWCIPQSSELSDQLANKIILLNNNRKLLSSAASKITSRKTDGAKTLADTVNRIIDN